MNVGILGGGQLGRMLALEGRPLGLHFRFLEPNSTDPVDGLGTVIRAEYDDAEALKRFADGLDVVTFEFENVAVEAVRRLAELVPVRPGPKALETGRDRLNEKRTFASSGIPTAPFVTVDSHDDLRRGVETLGLPTVLKTRSLGYDGKGQAVLRSTADIGAAWEKLGGVPLLLEGFVDFERELSVVAVRGVDGTCGFYPLVENVHRDGILWTSRAPAPDVDSGLQREAEGFALRLLEHLEYVGVLAIELFHCDGRLVGNEMAPRVHNTGHWTLDGAGVSQFENHLRAVCGLPLGSTESRGASGMLNLLGSVPPVEDMLAIPGAHVHLYDKSPRPGRKVGHVNVVCETVEEVSESLHALQGLTARGEV